MEWKNVIGKLAPTVLSGLLGPAGGAIAALVGDVLGVDSATQTDVANAIERGNLTGDQIVALKELELKLQAEEKERGFRYTELEFKDRDSARDMAVKTGAKTPALLTWLIVVIVLGLEGYILFDGTPKNVSELVMGRILGTLDTTLGLVLAYWFGTSHGSSVKTEMLGAQNAK